MARETRGLTASPQPLPAVGVRVATEQKVRLGGTGYTENPSMTVSVQQSIPTGVPAYDFEALNDPLRQVRHLVGNHVLSDT